MNEVITNENAPIIRRGKSSGSREHANDEVYVMAENIAYGKSTGKFFVKTSGFFSDKSESIEKENAPIWCRGIFGGVGTPRYDDKACSLIIIATQQNYCNNFVGFHV